MSSEPSRAPPTAAEPLAEDAKSFEGGRPVSAGPPPAVQTKSLTKAFGAVTACGAVDIELHRGEIHGILGENGAGKSTLMRMLIGLVIPDSGSIIVNGTLVEIPNPVAAAKLGIGMVHQHFSLVEALTVWENVTLGDHNRLDRAGTRDDVAELGDRYGLHVDPDARVGDLAVGLRQRVEVLKCLRRQPDILIFDEPTAVLTPEESEELFFSLRQVVEQEGRSVALVSHKLAEILVVTDRVTVMRNGRVVDHRPTSASDAGGLARAMVGREVKLRTAGPKQDDDGTRGLEGPATNAVPALELRHLEVREPGRMPEIDDLTMEVQPGEIFGLAGVEGNGQSVLVDLLSGLRTMSAGEIRVSGTVIDPSRIGAAGDAGIAVIPEDRHDSGIVLEMTVAENLMLSDPSRFATSGLIDKTGVREEAQRLIELFDIMCTGPEAPMWTLSGGNQQRVVLARELASEPVVLVAGQPTRGLDVGAIEYMSDRLRRVADSGVGILLISSELDEIFELADRIAVIYRGQITGLMHRSVATRERVGLLMGGDLL